MISSLLKDPMTFMSPLELSYFVKYPKLYSFKLQLAKTNKNPFFF